jgi:hypothetical protein
MTSLRRLPPPPGYSTAPPSRSTSPSPLGKFNTLLDQLAPGLSMSEEQEALHYRPQPGANQHPFAAMRQSLEALSAERLRSVFEELPPQLQQQVNRPQNDAMFPALVQLVSQLGRGEVFEFTAPAENRLECQLRSEELPDAPHEAVVHDLLDRTPPDLREQLIAAHPRANLAERFNAPPPFEVPSMPVTVEPSNDPAPRYTVADMLHSLLHELKETCEALEVPLHREVSSVIERAAAHSQHDHSHAGEVELLVDVQDHVETVYRRAGLPEPHHLCAVLEHRRQEALNRIPQHEEPQEEEFGCRVM